jgi:ParB/RepB/Spo0J family partition protein
VKFAHVPKEKLILRAQIRNHPPEYLRRLGESLLQCQLQPVGVLKDFTVIFGNGRVLAALEEPRITHLDAVILDEEISEREFLRRQAVENFVRNDLSNAEKCKICVSYAQSEPSMTLKEIAKDLGVDPSLVTRWMAWEKIIDPVRQALVADKLTLTGMYAISQLPAEEQEAALAVALNAPNAAAVARAVRKQRNGNGQSAVRMPKIKIPLANDAATGLVVVSGESIDLDDAETLLKEALKAVRSAKDKSLDCKTAQAVWRDVANAE